MPSTTAALPVMLVRALLSPTVREAIGPPRIRIINPDAMIEAPRGMITTGMSPRSQRGTAGLPMSLAA